MSDSHRKFQEEVILSQWLRGEHLGDMNAVTSRDFKYYPKVFGFIKEHGTEEFLRRGVREKIVTGQEYLDINDKKEFSAMYESYIQEIMMESVRGWIAEHPEASAKEVSRRVKEVAERAPKVPAPLEDPYNELLAEFDRRQQEKTILTGIKGLDELMWGVRRGELTFVGARPSVGKSAFLLQVALKVAEMGEKVLFLSLEMPALTMWQRVLLRKAYIPQAQLRSGNIDYRNPRVVAATDYLMEVAGAGNLVIISNSRDLSVIKELISIHKPYMLVIDQLQQMDDKTMHFKDIRTRFSHMTRELQNIALGEDIAVWCACQINRSADDSVPTMANLKEAGNIEEDATNVILLHRESAKVEDQIINCELAKQKEGACGEFKLVYHAPRFTFDNTIPDNYF